MPYLVSSILAIVAATIILLTRYEADDSVITAELDRMKSMFSMVDGFVNTFVQSGGDLTTVNFEELDKAGVLSPNVELKPPSDNFDKNPKDDNTGQNQTELKFPLSEVVWQLIPNKDDASSYKLSIDMRKDTTLISKRKFSESFSSREFCEKMLFGTVVRNAGSYVPADKEFPSMSGSDGDGVFVCIIYK